MVSSTKLVTGAAAAVTAGSLVFAGASLARADSTTDSNAAGSSTSSAQADRGRGGHAHTEVTGDEATKVTKAVTTTDSAVTVESVRKDPDGSYDVMGTKSGERVMVEVSADLKSVEVRTGGPARDNGQQATRSDEATSARTTVPSTGTSPTSIPSVA